MQKIILKIEKTMSSYILIISCCLLSIASVLGLLQVLFRFVFTQATPWTEVLIRFSLIWMVMFGVVIAFRQGALVSIDLLYRLSRGKFNTIVRLFILIVTLCLLVVLLWFGLDLTWRVRHQEIAGLEPMSISWAYLSIPTGAFFSIITVIANFFDPRHMELEVSQ